MARAGHGYTNDDSYGYCYGFAASRHTCEQISAYSLLSSYDGFYTEVSLDVHFTQPFGDHYDRGTWLKRKAVSYDEVPEPTTLAIFALGLMGLASRRFKKQS